MDNISDIGIDPFGFVHAFLPCGLRFFDLRQSFDPECFAVFGLSYQFVSAEGNIWAFLPEGGRSRSGGLGDLWVVMSPLRFFFQHRFKRIFLIFAEIRLGLPCFYE
jgi:hypothetical protein